MKDFEVPDCAKLADDVTRYAWGELPEGSRPAVEQHLQHCTACSELISFVDMFSAAARENRGRRDSPSEHPDPSLIVDLEADELEEERARQVSVHLLDCKPCREAYLRLRRLSDEQFEEKVLAGVLEGPERALAWTKVILRAVRGLLESLSVTGSGMLLQPAYAGVGRGETEVLSDRLRLEDTVVDPKTKAASKVQMEIKADPKAETVSLVLEVAPARPDWKVYLFDAEERELASMPLAAEESQIGSKLPAGSYTVRIRKGPDALASFAIEIRAA